MNHPLVVRGLECLRDLTSNRQRFVERQRTGRKPIGQRRPLDELHHQRVGFTGIFQAVYGRYFWMVERREELRFTLEACQAIGIGRECVRKNLQRDITIELRVVRPIHLAHSAGTEQASNLVRAEPRADRNSQWEGP